MAYFTSVTSPETWKREYDKVLMQDPTRDLWARISEGLSTQESLSLARNRFGRLHLLALRMITTPRRKQRRPKVLPFEHPNTLDLDPNDGVFKALIEKTAWPPDPFYFRKSETEMVRQHGGNIGYTLRMLVSLVNYSRKPAPFIAGPPTPRSLSSQSDNYRSAHAVFDAPADTIFAKAVNDLDSSLRGRIARFDPYAHPKSDVYKSTADVVRTSVNFAKRILDAVAKSGLHINSEFLTRSVDGRQKKIVDIGPLRTNLRLVAIDDGGLDGRWENEEAFRIASLEAKGPPLAGEDVDEMSDQDFGHTLAQALGVRLWEWKYSSLKRVYIIVVALHYFRFFAFDISDDYIVAMKNDFPLGTNEFIKVTSTRRLDITRYSHRRAVVNNIFGIMNTAKSKLYPGDDMLM